MAVTRFRLYSDALRHLADARLATITDDSESRYALDDAYPIAVEFVTRQAAWRHALKTIGFATSIGPLPGFAYAYDKPSDWLHTHALFVLTEDGRERPIDIREQGASFSANIGSGVYLRYISSDFLDPELTDNPWPEHFAQAVAAYLAFLVADRVTGEHGAAGRMSQLFSSLLGSATQHDALPENPWLQWQLDGTFVRTIGAIAKDGFWRFALKTASINTPIGPGTGGFAHSYAVPADWLRTRELYILTTDGRHRPIDIREHANVWQTNAASFYVEYVSADLAGRSDLWPEPYEQAVMRALTAQRGDAEAKDQAADFKLGAATLGEARTIETVAEDPWLSYQLDGSFVRLAYYLANQGFWRFTLKTVLMSTMSGPGEGGLSRKFAIPDDQLMTRELYQLTADGQHRPFDIREHGRFWHTNAGRFYAQYVSSELALRSELWPDQYLQALLRLLVAERGDAEAKDQGIDFKLGAAALGNAEAGEALGDNPWLEHQLSGAYARCMPAVIARGWWRFALRTIQLDANVINGSGGQDTGFDLMYPYRFPLPSDWVQTHALFIAWNGTDCPIDIKEHEGLWLTATPLFLARYLSTAAYDATLWPESLAKAVLAYLELDEDEDDEPGEMQGQKPSSKQDMAAIWQDAFGAALEEASLPRHPWTRHQLNGSFLQCARWVLEQARWRFAIRSVLLEENTAPLPGDPIEVGEDGSVTAPAQHAYAFRFIKPNDWLRTIWFGRQINEGLAGLHVDTDYIDEGYTLHANWAPMQLRYLSVERGLDPTQWTAHFRDALLAYLEHIEARGNPKLASLAAERFKFFQLQLREAESNDDSRDGPLYRQVGRVVRARYGWGRGYGIGPGYGPSQGWWG